MRNEMRKAFILKLDGIIAALQQATVLGGRSAKDGEACELLKDARLKFVEQLEGEDAPPTELEITDAVKKAVQALIETKHLRDDHLPSITEVHEYLKYTLHMDLDINEVGTFVTGVYSTTIFPRIVEREAPPVDLVAEMYEKIESPGYNELPEDDPLFVHPEDRQ